MKIKMSKSKSSNECFYSPKIYARQILKDVFEKFETEKGFFYSFLKNYVLDFENNDEYINSNLKNVVVFLLKYSKDVGEKTALQNLALCLKDMNKNVTNDLYSNLKLACRKTNPNVIKKRIENYSPMI